MVDIAKEEEPESNKKLEVAEVEGKKVWKVVEEVVGTKTVSVAEVVMVENRKDIVDIVILVVEVVKKMQEVVERNKD